MQRILYIKDKKGEILLFEIKNSIIQYVKERGVMPEVIKLSIKDYFAYSEILYEKVKREEMRVGKDPGLRNGFMYSDIKVLYYTDNLRVAKER